MDSEITKGAGGEQEPREKQAGRGIAALGAGVAVGVGIWVAELALDALLPDWQKNQAVSSFAMAALAGTILSLHERLDLHEQSDWTQFLRILVFSTACGVIVYILIVVVYLLTIGSEPVLAAL